MKRKERERRGSGREETKNKETGKIEETKGRKRKDNKL
jgi:hypothetical protein